MSTSQPDVSVIVPVGAVDAVLERQVRAIVEQQLDRPFELVLSLNVSDAAAAAELDRMLAAIGDGCVRVVDSSDRKGAAHARNVGIRASVGRLVACCDADDMVHAGWLAALVLGLADHDAVSGHVIDVFPEPHMAKWHPPATPDSLPTFLGVPYVLTGNLGVRRAAFDAVDGFDDSLIRCEDIAFGWALVRAGFTLAYAPDAVIDYRHRAGRWSMMRQHYHYGRGMSQVLKRYGVPVDGRWDSGKGVGVLRPNAQPVEHRTLMGALRRASLGVGRVVGYVRHRGGALGG